MMWNKDENNFYCSGLVVDVFVLKRKSKTDKEKIRGVKPASYPVESFKKILKPIITSNKYKIYKLPLQVIAVVTPITNI